MAKNLTGLPSWMLPTSKKGFRPQVFDYILALDFEATCLENARISPQEIIEFPCLKISTKTFDIENEFHTYVKPQFHPTLSEFCTSLTGISQDTVEHQPDFITVLDLFDKWLKSQKIENSSFVVLTCGNWDLNTCLRHQCDDYNIKYPSWATKWINLKKAHQKVFGHFPRSFATILSDLDLQFEGRPHSGIDDTKNIAKAVKALALKGHVFEVTDHI